MHKMIAGLIVGAGLLAIGLVCWPVALGAGVTAWFIIVGRGVYELFAYRKDKSLKGGPYE